MFYDSQSTYNHLMSCHNHDPGESPHSSLNPIVSGINDAINPSLSMRQDITGLLHRMHARPNLSAFRPSPTAFGTKLSSINLLSLRFHGWLPCEQNYGNLHQTHLHFNKNWFSQLFIPVALVSVTWRLLALPLLGECPWENVNRILIYFYLVYGKYMQRPRLKGWQI